MKRLTILLLAALLLLTPGGLVAQETVPNQGRFFPQPGARKLDGDVWVTGNLYVGTAQTDWIVWYPAVHYCKSDIPSAQLSPTRVAQFDWALARTAAGAETYNIVCTLDLPTRTATSAGAKITAVDVSYFVGTANLTTHTFGGIRSVTYVDNAANAIATFGGTITGPTLATTFRVTPYLSTASFGTPTFVNTVDRAILIEWQAVMANTGVYRVYGIAVKYTRAD